jgi:Pyridoxamine 5'-phosphate oxidase
MIDDAIAAFLEQGLGIHLGTRNGQLEPTAAHVPAVLVDADRVHLTVFVPRVAAGRVLADLESNGQAAVVFGRPEDDRSCQVKGTFVSARDATDAERHVVERQWRGFMAQLELIGLPGEADRQWAIWPCVALRIRVRSLFSQTPGPDAGAPLS